MDPALLLRADAHQQGSCTEACRRTFHDNVGHSTGKLERRPLLRCRVSPRRTRIPQRLWYLSSYIKQSLRDVPCCRVPTMGAVSADQMLFLHGTLPHSPLLSVSSHESQHLQPWPVSIAATSLFSPPSLALMSSTNAKSPTQAEKPAFVFIDESAKSTKDKRRAIRSQAKRFAIAERSKRPRKIRFVNIQGSKEDQNPVDDEAEDVPEHDTANATKAVVHKPRQPIMLPDLPKTGYEAARIEFGFDIFLLSGLASVHVGRGASLQLQDTKLGNWLMGFRETSYLDHMPLHYNSSPLVRSVVNCTMAQYRRAIYSDSKITESTVFKLYGKALQDLQTALNDDERRLQPDVLLATAVLQLFEVSQCYAALSVPASFMND
jgi:hypothetical protein